MSESTNNDIIPPSQWQNVIKSRVNPQIMTLFRYLNGKMSLNHERTHK